MIGKIVGHYRILELLSQTSMSTVYKAQNIHLRNLVALKFLTCDPDRDSSARKRFIQEARAASAVPHHNICTIHDIHYAPDGQFFICMDYYEGETLKKKIQRTVLSLPEAVHVAIQVTDGLSVAHAKSIVHGDINPSNLFITKDHILKILDFGLSRLCSVKTGRTASDVSGTVAYMSPEQLRGDEYGATTDIWSLGVVLYEMLTGRLPFSGEYDHTIIYSILNLASEPLNLGSGRMIKKIGTIIERMLEKDPRNRYINCMELRNDLQAVIRSKPSLHPLTL